MRILQHWIANLGLWPRMALGISLGFFALFVAFSILGERALRESADRILEERLVIARMVATQFDSLLQQSVINLEQARTFADFDPTDPDLTDEAHILAHIYGQAGIFASGVAFLDAEGRTVLSHPSHLYASSADLWPPSHVAQALAQRSVTISEPLTNPSTDQTLVAITVPVGDNGRLLGLLSGQLDLSGPLVGVPLSEAAALGHTGHALLVDRQGRILAATFPAPFLSPGEHASFYRAVLSWGEPTVKTVPLELATAGQQSGHGHVMAVVPLQMAPWAVAVGGDADETFASVGRLRLGLILLGVIALAGTWATTLLGTRRLVRPVQRLTAAAQRIASGDLHTPLQAPEGGEIGAMATVLDRMRRQLLGNITELANLNETLEARVAERTKALQQQQILARQLLRQAITAQEEERARLSRELHDEIGQMLTAVQLSLERLGKALPAADAIAHERLELVQRLTMQALADLRRTMAALRPGVLDQLGLVPALGWVADHTLRPLGLDVTIETRGLGKRLPGELETILFRIAQEAMSNVARHSQASRLTIYLVQVDHQVIMTLIDDGTGFDATGALRHPAAASAVPHERRSLGLAGMQERASLAGGQVIIESAPGQGTTVRVIVPLPMLAGEHVEAEEQAT